MPSENELILERARNLWKGKYAFGLPAGSVRALLSLIVFGGIWGWMYSKPDNEVPSYFRDLMFIIMGHYYAVRHKTGTTLGPAPLFLPRGSVRSILILGCCTVAGMLIYQHRMTVKEPDLVRLSHAGVMLILVAGFMLGVVVNAITKDHSAPRWLQDLQAAIALGAGVLLVCFTFGFLHLPTGGAWHNVQRWALHYRIEDILAAIVGFYFGSR